MKKIISCIVASVVVLFACLPFAADAQIIINDKDAEKIYGTIMTSREDYNYSFEYLVENFDGAEKNSGYLYIMDDGLKPEIEDALLLSDICKEASNVEVNYPILVCDNAFKKYGDVYYSEQLADNKDGIKSIIAIETFVESIGKISPEIYVYLDYDSIEEFNSEQDAFLESIQSCLPEDEYGYELLSDASVSKYKDRNCVGITLTSSAYLQQIETPVSAIFSAIASTSTTENDFEAWLGIIDSIKSCDKVLGTNVAFVSNMKDRTITIDDGVFIQEQIKYNVVYSAAPTNGDYNNDGLLEITDAQNLLSYSAAHVAGTTESLPIVSSAPENMDVDGDGEITVADAQYVLTYCAQQAAGMNPTWEDILK